MDPLSVVVLDPGRKSVGAGLVARDGLPVSLLGCKGPFKAFDLAILPRAVRLDELLLHLQPRDGVSERGRVAVGERVVGDDPFDPAQAVLGEVGGSPGGNSAAMVPFSSGWTSA